MATLEGAQTTIMPYVRGHELFGRDALHAVWRMMEDERKAPLLFWSQLCQSEYERGDLLAFIETIGRKPLLLLLTELRLYPRLIRS